jgi:hypothetical protein
MTHNRQPTSLLHLRRAGNILLVQVRSGNEVQLWRLATADFPGVALLSAQDRAQVEGAVRTLYRDLEVKHGRQ